MLIIIQLVRFGAELHFALGNFNANDIQVAGLLFLLFNSAFHLKNCETTKADSTLNFNASFATLDLVSRYCCKSDVAIFEGEACV